MFKLLTLVALLTLISCAPSGLNKQAKSKLVENDYLSVLDKSYQRWLKLKQNYANNYSYKRDSVIQPGFNSSTKLVIENDQVEYRYFFQWQTGNTPSLTWSEDFAELGLHNQGASVKTLDELYQQCETSIINKSIADYAITLELDQLNVLKQCSYTQINCHQGCTKGIRIQSLSL